MRLTKKKKPSRGAKPFQTPNIAICFTFSRSSIGTLSQYLSTVFKSFEHLTVVIECYYSLPLFGSFTRLILSVKQRALFD